MQATQSNTQGYCLLDSGEGQKLEQFGGTVIARPSSVCLWKKRTPALWEKADARYEIERGWQFRKDSFESWSCKIAECSVRCHLQTNGQVGHFPEHGLYLPELAEKLNQLELAGNKQMLNTFAYTGLASIFFARQGFEICHVDMSKKALSWASENLELNKIETKKVRFICDDALKFIEREVKRGNKYHIVMTDPPSFSRISKTKHWKLDENLAEVVTQCVQLLNSEGGLIVFTCHDPGLSCEMVANVFYDALGKMKFEISKRELGIQEHNSSRIMPAGTLVYALVKN